MTSDALRICMVTTFYPPYHFGGDAIAVQRLSRALARLGHHVTVVHDVDAFRVLQPDAPATADVPADDDGVTVVRLESPLRALSPLLTQQLGRPVAHKRRLQRLLADGEFDVVNFHNVSLIGGPGVLGMGGSATRVYMAHEHWLVCPTHVLWRHARELCTGRECLRCTMHYRRPPQLWRYTGTLDRALRHVDAFIAMSEFSRAKHHEFGFPHEMEVLPPFLPETGQLPPTVSPHHRPYFLFAGRLERIKGLDDVIPLFRAYPDADLLIAGEGTHAPALQALAAGNDRVKFLGHVAAEELRGLYQHALAFIMPSLCFETFGLGLIEAFRQSTPVIARRLGPFPEIVQQSGAGLLFTTTAELTAAMRSIQHEPLLRERLSVAARDAFLQRWTEEVVVPRYLDIVRRAGQNRAQGAMARTPGVA